MKGEGKECDIKENKAGFGVRKTAVQHPTGELLKTNPQRTHLTSSPLCTKLAATKSNLCRTAKLTRSSMSLLVNTGRSTCTPGRLTFLF